MWLRLISFPVLLLAGLGVMAGALLGLIILFAYPNLPTLEVLTDYRPKVPLRVYSAEGLLIGEFGEERRAIVAIGEVPEVMKQAILKEKKDRLGQFIKDNNIVTASYEFLT